MAPTRATLFLIDFTQFTLRARFQPKASTFGLYYLIVFCLYHIHSLLLGGELRMKYN